MLDSYGITVTGQHVTAKRIILACRVRQNDDFCHQCGGQARVRGSLVRNVTHVPVGWRPTQLQLRLRRYRGDDCCRVWQQDTAGIVASGEKLSYPAALWALKSVVTDRLSIARVADNLGVSWNTANDAVLDTGR